MARLFRPTPSHAVLAVAALAAVLSPPLAGPASAQGGAASQTQPYDIDRNGVLMLVRSALLALDHANETGNYTVLRDLGAPGFQRNDAARLAELFAPYRARELDLGAVLVLEPQLTVMPRIENGRLRIAGFFPSAPAQVSFDLLFAPVDRQWRLYAISLDVAPAGPFAPDAEPEPQPEASVELPDPPIPTVNPRRFESGD